MKGRSFDTFWCILVVVTSVYVHVLPHSYTFLPSMSKLTVGLTSIGLGGSGTLASYGRADLAIATVNCVPEYICEDDRIPHLCTAFGRQGYEIRFPAVSGQCTIP